MHPSKSTDSVIALSLCEDDGDLEPFWIGACDAVIDEGLSTLWANLGRPRW